MQAGGLVEDAKDFFTVGELAGGVKTAREEEGFVREVRESGAEVEGDFDTLRRFLSGGIGEEFPGRAEANDVAGVHGSAGARERIGVVRWRALPDRASFRRNYNPSEMVGNVEKSEIPVRWGVERKRGGGYTFGDCGGGKVSSESIFPQRDTIFDNSCF